MLKQEQDLLELRLNSNGSIDKRRGEIESNKNQRDGTNQDEGNESDEDALSSRVYQNLLGEYNMLSDVNLALE